MELILRLFPSLFFFLFSQVTYETCLEKGLMTKLRIKKGTSVIYSKQLVKVTGHVLFRFSLFVFLRPQSREWKRGRVGWESELVVEDEEGARPEGQELFFFFWWWQRGGFGGETC